MNPDEYDRLAAMAEWDEEVEWERFNREGPIVEPPTGINYVINFDGIIDDSDDTDLALTEMFNGNR